MLEDTVTEGYFVDISPDYLCLYDVRSKDFNNRNKREKAIAHMSQKLEKSGLTRAVLMSLGAPGHISVKGPSCIHICKVLRENICRQK